MAAQTQPAAEAAAAATLLAIQQRRCACKASLRFLCVICNTLSATHMPRSREATQSDGKQREGGSRTSRQPWGKLNLSQGWNANILRAKIGHTEKKRSGLAT